MVIDQLILDMLMVNDQMDWKYQIKLMLMLSLVPVQLQMPNKRTEIT
jgi:hypothetical protein